MRTRAAWIGVVVAALIAGAGCGGAPGGPTTATPGLEPTTPVGASSDPPAQTFLDGTWEATITRRAYLRYLARHGVRRADALAAAERDHPGEEFSVRFLDGMFNVTGPTGESWHQGDFEVHGEELHLWDDGYREAGIPPFRLLMTRAGDVVQFEVAPGQVGDEHLPGVPELVAGGALWCPAPWSRVT